jgi:Ran GTPase-activating protein (RanGAP) involved in mRNA processing and transport
VSAKLSDIDLFSVSVACVDLLLQSFSKLISLTLTKCQMGEDSTKLLADNLQYAIALGVLSLTYNQIGNEGCIALANALQKSTAPLTTLNLSDNLIGDGGALAVGRVLRSCKSLTLLDFKQNQITDYGATLLSEDMLVRLLTSLVMFPCSPSSFFLLPSLIIISPWSQFVWTRICHSTIGLSNSWTCRTMHAVRRVQLPWLVH